MHLFGSFACCRPTHSQHRPKIASVVSRPAPCWNAAVRRDIVTIHVGESAVADESQFVRELRKLPPLALRLPSAHQCIAPVERRVICEINRDSLIEMRAGKWNHRSPLAPEIPTGLDTVARFENSGCAGISRMHLRRRLRAEPDCRTRLDDHRLAQAVAAEHSWSRRRDDQVDATTIWQRTANAIWRLGVRMPQPRPAATLSERQVETGLTANVGRSASVDYRSNSSSF